MGGHILGHRGEEMMRLKDTLHATRRKVTALKAALMEKEHAVSGLNEMLCQARQELAEAEKRLLCYWEADKPPAASREDADSAEDIAEAHNVEVAGIEKQLAKQDARIAELVRALDGVAAAEHYEAAQRIALDALGVERHGKVVVAPQCKRIAELEAAIDILVRIDRDAAHPLPEEDIIRLCIAAKAYERLDCDMCYIEAECLEARGKQPSDVNPFEYRNRQRPR